MDPKHCWKGYRNQFFSILNLFVSRILLWSWFIFPPRPSFQTSLPQRISSGKSVVNIWEWERYRWITFFSITFPLKVWGFIFELAKLRLLKSATRLIDWLFRGEWLFKLQVSIPGFLACFLVGGRVTILTWQRPWTGSTVCPSARPADILVSVSQILFIILLFSFGPVQFRGIVIVYTYLLVVWDWNRRGEKNQNLVFSLNILFLA